MRHTKQEYINARKSGRLFDKKMFLCKPVQAIAVICLLGISSLATALPDGEPSKEKRTPIFVDSVYGWGTWELGIEPAAGGPAPMSNRALNVRLSKVKFRPNDNTTFSPGASSKTITTPVAPAKLEP